MTARRIPPDDVLERVRALAREGLTIQAYEAARSFAPLREWAGPEGRLAASWLAEGLGAPRLGDALCRLARKESPDHAGVVIRYGHFLLVRRGPLAAIEFFDASGDNVSASAEQRADMLAIRAAALSAFRDFDRAHRLLDEAVALDPDDDWPALIRIQVLEAEDRYDEALERARAMSERRPGMFQATQAVAHLLQLLGRDSEALALLAPAAERFESGEVAMHLAGMYSENESYDDLRATLDRYEALSPLLEPGGRRRLAACRADVAYANGDLEAAIELVRQSESPFHRRIASRLAVAVGRPRRVVLPVGFVRQHHKTCVPATLSAVTAYWGRPADHLQVAEEICYDGTTAHSERAWAEAHGWTVREFTVTWESAVALLDRGVPFTFTTRNGDSGHLQAAIGYDTLRETLFLRDPFFRHRVEAAVGPLLEDQRHSGPRGMAIVPRERASLLEGLDLPDAAIYDRYHSFESALLSHDRRRAVSEMATLAAEAGGHRLAPLARLSLAVYDADVAAQLAELDLWIERYPSDIAMRLMSFSCLDRLGRRAELVRRAEEAATGANAHPLFWSIHAKFLAEDARRHDEAVLWLRRAIRLQPTEPRHLDALADILLRRSETAASLALRRLAATLGNSSEQYAISYFRAARASGHPEEGLAFLEARNDRLGRKSAGPGVSLAVALAEMDRARQAFKVLEAAMRAHPDDGSLLVVAADAYRGFGRLEAAALLLDRAQGRCPESGLLVSRAALALAVGQRQSARSAWDALAAKDPHAVAAHEALAILDALDVGVEAALQRLRRAAEQAPHHVGLQRLHLKWLQIYRPDLVEPALHRIVSTHPEDADARLALAKTLIGCHRIEEAREHIDVVLERVPDHPAARAALGDLLLRGGRLEEAREAYREALRRSADEVGAIPSLAFHLTTSAAERRAVLRWLGDELRRQSTSDEGLRAFGPAAESVLDSGEIRAFLSDIAASRPDSWAARSALIAHDIACGRMEEALAGALEASRRFPLHAGAWLDLSEVRRRLGDDAAEIESLRRALHVRPAWHEAAHRLARAHARAGRTAETRSVLDGLPPTQPPDARHEAEAATILWMAGDRDGAVNRLRAAVRLQPRVAWGWNVLGSWASELGRDLVEPLAREIAAERPDDPGAWCALAKVLSGPERLEERLDALERALGLAPWDIEIHDAKARCLAEAERHEEALAACTPATWGNRVPFELRGRRAWVLYQQGLRDDAVDAMHALVQENPGYLWAWCQIAEWARSAENVESYAVASARLVDLDPSNALSHAYLGDALLRRGDRPGAKASLRRALAMDPAIVAAISLLFTAQIEDGELEEAAATLDAGRPHLPAGTVLLSEVRLACRRGSRAEATDAFRRLCCLPDASWRELAEATNTVAAALSRNDAIDALERGMQDPCAGPFPGALWITLMMGDRRLLACARRLRDWACREETWTLAALRYMDGLHRMGNRAMFLELIDEHAKRLHGDNRTWAEALDTFVDWAELARIREWVRGWEARQELEPWMCAGLSLALRGLGADDEASRALKRGLEGNLRPPPALRVWAAFDEAVRGSSDAAAEILATIDAARLEPEDGFVLRLASAMATMDDGGDSVGRRFARARRLLEQAEWLVPNYRKSLVLRPALRRAVARIATSRGGWVARLWLAYRKLARSA